MEQFVFRYTWVKSQNDSIITNGIVSYELREFHITDSVSGWEIIVRNVGSSPDYYISLATYYDKKSAVYMFGRLYERVRFSHPFIEMLSEKEIIK